MLEKRKKSVLHFALFDPHKTSGEEARESSRLLKELGTDAFLIGGSIGVDPSKASAVAKSIKESTGLPVIIFPGDLGNIVREADAILFMSLLNSDNPYYIIGAQVQGAPLVKAYGLEPLPTAYIIIGYGGAAGFIGKARPIPWDQPFITLSYVLAARMLGMKYVYLEAGSGSPRPVPPEMIRVIKKHVPDVFLIVGGGIRDYDSARKAVEAGADAIVTGTIIEESIDKAKSIIDAIKK